MTDATMAIGPAGNLEGRTALEFSPLTDILPKHSDGNTNDTVAAPATNVAIVGAGRGGTALLELLHQIPSIHIVAIADRDPLAPGLQRARARPLFNVKDASVCSLRQFPDGEREPQVRNTAAREPFIAARNASSELACSFFRDGA
jgi:hypothetical protein